MRCPAPSWLSLSGTDLAHVLSLLLPPLGSEHRAAFNRQLLCCEWAGVGGLWKGSGVGWGSNQGRSKRKPVWALGLSHILQSIWTSNKADILIPPCLR